MVSATIFFFIKLATFYYIIEKAHGATKAPQLSVWQASPLSKALTFTVFVRINVSTLLVAGRAWHFSYYA